MATLAIVPFVLQALAYQHDEAASHALTRRLMSYDPHDARVAALHYTNLTVLRRSAELFQLAHASVKAAPRGEHAPQQHVQRQHGTRTSKRAIMPLCSPCSCADPLSWYAVGCYYLTLDRPAVASRHFTKATQLDPAHALSWIGLGQCFALLQEHEPAMHAYRAACLLLPRAHVPQLAMAAVAARNGQITLAKQYLDAATALCMSDPLVYHEAGVLEYKQGAYGTAWCVTAQQLPRGAAMLHVTTVVTTCVVNRGLLDCVQGPVQLRAQLGDGVPADHAAGLGADNGCDGTCVQEARVSSAQRARRRRTDCSLVVRPPHRCAAPPVQALW